METAYRQPDASALVAAVTSAFRITCRYAAGSSHRGVAARQEPPDKAGV